MSSKNQLSELDYQLVDSGDLMKLERFGDKLISRPSSTCIWKRRKTQQEWSKADAELDPKTGWSFKGKHFDDWTIGFGQNNLKLRLQSNGQVGVFPEHQNYLGLINEIKKDAQELKVLNLFAYTGMASVYALARGAHVTHVDINKKSLDWFSENIALNNFDKTKTRLICDDSQAFLKKEAKRGNSYDLIILDPPSFSRLDKNKTWDLENVLCEMLSDAAQVMNKERSAIFVSCHHSGISKESIANILSDVLPGKTSELAREDLLLHEAESERKINLGSLYACITGS